MFYKNKKNKIMLLIPKNIPLCSNLNILGAFQNPSVPQNIKDLAVLHNSQRISFYNFFEQIQHNPDREIRMKDYDDLKAYLFTVYDIYENICTNSSDLLDHHSVNQYYSMWANRPNTLV